MLSKNQIKFIRSLQLKKFREIHRQFTAEGTKLVIDLLEGQVPARQVFATSDWIGEHREKIIGDLVMVTDEELSRVTTLTTAPPVLAVFDIPDISYSPDLINSGLVLLLDDIRDPGNLGTIIRIADWFGIRQVICSETTVDLYNPKVIQATMGSVARVGVSYADPGKWLAQLPAGTRVYGASLEGEDLYKRNLSASGVIVIGNESNGISAGVQQYVTDKIFIPSFSTSAHAESLNASVATAVVCAEFRRRSLFQQE
jgi:RNA methyltransferase, TrmH family